MIAVHGIRGQAGSALDHAHRIARSGRLPDVRVACLKGTPVLDEVVADLGGRDVLLAPLLMADGYTLKAMRARLAPIEPTLRSLTVAPPLGVNPALADLIIKNATDACRAHGWLPVETDLLIAAHGTKRDPNSGRSAFDHIAIIKERATFAGVRIGFLDQAPMLADVVAANRACRHVTVGLFIDRGEHGEEDIPAILEDADPAAVYTGPIGVNVGITDLLLMQIEAARMSSPIASNVSYISHP